VHHWTDQAFLRDVQYRTDANLAARQSIYQYQRPYVDLVAEILDVAEVADGDTVADVGCGNGRYLAGLATRGHTGRLLGVDMSPGMLAVTRDASGARPVVADAARLPLRNGAADITLAMHMLYHVPDPAQAVREFRRVTRPGGRVIVGLNASDHLTELRTIITSVMSVTTGDAEVTVTPVDEPLTLDRGEMLLRPAFGSVARHDFTGTIELTEFGPLAGYLRSLSGTDPEALVEAVTNAIDLPFYITTHSGCLVCT
jgi:SAM-dependent methyltransferase